MDVVLNDMAFPIQQGLFKYDLTDHYAVLGVSLDAVGQQIRQRYLKIAYVLHPDTCKSATESEKRRANKLLSKLVNPAYETLSKDQSRNEYRLVLTQMGKSLSSDLKTITLATESAQKLLQASANNLELVYHRLLLPLVAEQYNELDKVLEKTAQISELNLVYLMLKQGQGIQPKTKATSSTSVPSQPESESAPLSPVANAIRRAQGCFDRKNFSQAVIELREALKKDPNNSTCHGLIGLAYIHQNQLTMAKVHINKAWTVNPYDPVVINAKQALDQLLPDLDKSKQADKSESGLFGNLFGGKKKP